VNDDGTDADNDDEGDDAMTETKDVPISAVREWAEHHRNLAYLKVAKGDAYAAEANQIGKLLDSTADRLRYVEMRDTYGAKTLTLPVDFKRSHIEAALDAMGVPKRPDDDPPERTRVRTMADVFSDRLAANGRAARDRDDDEHDHGRGDGGRSR
jgi:hypothetical protein